jgi:hypothetical protein
MCGVECASIAAGILGDSTESTEEVLVKLITHRVVQSQAYGNRWDMGISSGMALVERAVLAWDTGVVPPRAMEGGHDGSTPVPVSSREEIERRDEMEPLRNPHDGADLARCDRRDLLELLSKAEQLAETAEERGVRWGLDHCHDLAVSAGYGKPNTSTDRNAVAAQVAARARAALGR